MKRKLIIIVGILIISFVDIQIKLKSVQAQSVHSAQLNYKEIIPTNVRSWTEYFDGMTYRIFTNGESIYVTNVTKDKLQIKKLKLEIQKLKENE